MLLVHLELKLWHQYYFLPNKLLVTVLFILYTHGRLQLCEMEQGINCEL